MATKNRSAISSEPGALEADVLEFATLLPATLRALKSATPPPAELHDAVHELGLRHRPALLAVALAGPLSVSDLAQRLGLGLSTTSAIVVELSAAGLVERSEDQSDRRRTLVRVHEDHLHALDAWTTQALAPIRRALSQLSVVERARFIETWRMLHAEATRAAEQRVEPADALAECE